MLDAARPEPAPPSEDPAVARPARAGGTDGSPGIHPADGAGAAPATDPLADPRALTILTTEHWGLLTARSLVYNETFTRGAMFLTFLSASLVGLGFVAGGGTVGSMLPVVAIAVLLVDLLVGLATLGRLLDATIEEFLALQGMARLRHAYLEIAPGLERYMSTARYDDTASVLGAYGPPTEENVSNLRNVGHGLTTMPGMIMAINSVLAGAIAGLLAVVVGLAPGAALAVSVIAGIATIAVFAVWAMRVFTTIDRRFEIRFPSPARLAARAPEIADQDPGRRNT